MRSKRTGIKCIFQKYYHTYSRRLKTTWSNDPNTDGVKNYIKIRCFRKCRAVVGRVLADRWAAGCWRHTCGRRRSSMYCHVERPRCSNEYNEHSLTTTATTSTTIIILWPLCTTTCTSRYLQLRTHTNTCLSALCPGLPRWAGTRKVKPIWILLKQETVSGSGITLAACKPAVRSTDNHASVPPLSFYRPDALPAAQPTVSKHWRQLRINIVVHSSFTADKLSGVRWTCIRPRWCHRHSLCSPEKFEAVN